MDNLPNGTVLLYRNGKQDKWYQQLICDWIEFASGSEYIHAVVILNGFKYETRHPGGFRKTIYSGCSKNTAIGRPKNILGAVDVAGKVSFWEDKIRKKLPYNYIKLFTALLLFKTKPIWEKLGWVPFQDINKFGDFCFAAVDESYKFVGIDIMPGQIEQISTGKHFTDSSFFNWENLVDD